MMSTFWHDGYRDAWHENLPSPPDVVVYRSEYLAGYQKCLDDMRSENSR